MIKLVLSDMDNTLIPLGQRVSPRTVEAIHAVLDAGVRFGPATGRDYVELSRLFRMHEECFMTGIFSNGKRVRLDGRYVSTTLIPHVQLVHIDQAIRGEKGMFLVCFPEETNLMNPAYGVGVSSAEDVVTTGGLWLALAHPLAAAIVALVGLATLWFNFIGINFFSSSSQHSYAAPVTPAVVRIDPAPSEAPL